MVKFIIIFILLQISFQEDITLKDNEPYEKEFKNPDYDIIFSTTAINITKPYIQIKTKAISNQALIYVNEGDYEPDFSNHLYNQFMNELNIENKNITNEVKICNVKEGNSKSSILFNMQMAQLGYVFEALKLKMMQTYFIRLKRKTLGK